MSLQILKTSSSEETVQSVYYFIKNKFGEKSAEQFINKAEKIISIIAIHPYLYKASDIDPAVRVALITKQTSLFYRVTDTAIHLLFFWDNRQEPLSY